MTYLLDTNIISAFRRIERTEAHVQRWAETLDVTQAFLSVITVLELERGTVLAEKRDPTFGNVLRTWLENDILPVFADRTFVVDSAVARRCATLSAIRTIEMGDALIAATALVHDLTVVTRNTSDYEGTGVRLLNPWDQR